MDFIYCTDKKIAPKVYISQKMYYNKEARERLMSLIKPIRTLMLTAGCKKTPVIRFASLVGDEGACYSGGMEIEICLTKLTTNKDILETVAHELVHARQYQSKELVMTGTDTDYFKGKPYTIKQGSYASYRRAPWEVEAFRLMKPLAKQVMKQYGVK